jgi:hypothetical protein
MAPEIHSIRRSLHALAKLLHISRCETVRVITVFLRKRRRTRPCWTRMEAPALRPGLFRMAEETFLAKWVEE